MAAFDSEAEKSSPADDKVLRTFKAIYGDQKRQHIQPYLRGQESDQNVWKINTSTTLNPEPIFTANYQFLFTINFRHDSEKQTSFAFSLSKTAKNSNLFHIFAVAYESQVSMQEKHCDNCPIIEIRQISRGGTEHFAFACCVCSIMVHTSRREICSMEKA